MHTIELTRGSGWSPQTVEKHVVERQAHIAEIEHVADSFLTIARRRTPGADGYRILDAAGRQVKQKQP